MKRLYVDLETYSDAPIAEVGAYRYAQDPSTRVLLFGCAFDDGPVDLTDLAHGERLPADVRQALTDPGVQKWAHNAAFERAILEHVLGIPCPPEQWRCTMVWAQTLSLPAGLAELAKELQLTAQKLDPDKRLVERFCTPRGRARQRRLDDDEAWEQFKEYCARDVRVCRDATTALAAYPVPGAEWRLWALDQRINDRGLPIDTVLVGAAQRAADAHSAAVMTQAREDTGVDNPGSRAQLLAWLAEQGVEVEDLRAGTVEALLKGELTPEVRQALEHRQQLAATSVAKYDVLARATWEGRLRGTFQFYGANRTGRWSGRLFQPHNLTRGKLKSVTDLATARAALLAGDIDWLRTLFGPDVTGVLSSLIRTAIAAPAGQQLVVADYASIESVMLAWAARSGYLLDLFRAGRDPYKDFATHLFHKDYDAVTKAERNLAKPATLGCGYGLGAAGLQRYAMGFGQVLDEAEARRQVGAYREAYPDIPRFWADVEAAALAALQTGESARVGSFTFRMDGSRYLFVDLPAGRALAYYKPRLERDGNRQKITYEGREVGKRARVGTHPGKLVENLVQAIARDVLAAGLLMTAQDPGLEIVGHVHDEILCLADADDAGALDRLLAAMCAPDWCPDAPIRAAGWTGPWYRKD